MRLLRVKDLQFEEFYDVAETDYAILSHVWGNHELSYHDINGRSKSEILSLKTESLKKLSGCRKKAQEAKIKYLWIDTCCIDKPNHSELSEAINSMFVWYQSSKVCYAYLEDVKLPEGKESSKDQKSSKDGKYLEEMALSNWFKRGWTLQELIAPKTVVFFDRNWKEIGTKEELITSISNITNISQDFLLGRALKEASIAQRMSWASERKTSKQEDAAYCLFGIFDVHMPMLYGEGLNAAFFRLQMEILQLQDDTSIFAWARGLDNPSGTNETFSLLAPSPAFFKDSHDIVSADFPVVTGFKEGIRTPVVFNNKGLHLSLPVLKKSKEQRLAILGCTKANKNKSRCAIWLQDISSNGGRYARTRDLDMYSLEGSNKGLHFKHLTTELRLFRNKEIASKRTWENAMSVQSRMNTAISIAPQ